ncbi:MAG: CotH kinase family protein [Clostridia bacterium]|nr:CotH kinase family protein [Clostridia bacterium]
MKKLSAFLLAALIAVSALCSCSGRGSVPTGPVVDIGDDREEEHILLSELMADNSGFVMNCLDDWVELYNSGENEAELTGYILAKNGAKSEVMKLDGIRIPAHGYAVVKLTDDSPFRLSKDGGGVTLIHGSKVVDELSYDASIGEGSFSHEGACEYPTPGYPNTAEGYAAYLDALELPGVRINEVVSSNSTHIPVDGEYYDFVEIYNGSGEAVDLSLYTLSDKKSEPERYRFPETTLEAGGYFIVYCSGNAAPDQAPFKISSSGETVYLFREGTLVDRVKVPGDLNKDASYGRIGKGFEYMSTVTPGAENVTGYQADLPAPTASLPSGAYDAPISVELKGEGDIYYTLDGTEPGEKSKKYTGPIEVNSIASIRAVAVDGSRRSELASFFYLVGIEHSCAVINVAIKSEYLTGSEGVLNHVDPEYEHEAFVTMMDQGELCFSVPCGFKLHGNDSKKGDKQNFQLRFRSVYGMSKLKYKVFENRDIDTFNSLLLKGGSEDFVFCGFRDELCTSLVDGATELSVQAYRPVILYLNGEYWGFYWLRERIDTEYCAQRLGVSADSINLVKDYGDSVVAGSGKGLMDLIKYCKTHDLRNKEDYDYVMRRIDSTSLMDWYICRSYMGDSDLANLRFYSSAEDDGRWHWCFFDLDWALWNNTEDPIGRTARNDGNHAIIVALLKNPDFRDKFLKRYAALMGSILNEQAITRKADELAAIMEPEIEADRARYGLSVSGWRSSIEKLKSYVKDGKRDRTVLAGIQNYFGLSDSEMKAYFGRTR